MRRASDFDPISRALRRGILDHFEAGGRDLDTDSGRRTLDTNSTLAEQRADVLAQTFLARASRSTLDGLRVVDLGCGFGALSLVLANRGAQVTGVDPNDARLRVAQEIAASFGLDATFRRGDFGAPGVEAGSAGLVVVNNAFCYLIPRRARREALRTIIGLLAPGGWIVMRDPNRLTPRDPFTGLPLVHQLSPRVGNRLAVMLGRDRSSVRLASPGSACRALRGAGFEAVRYDGSGGVRRLGDRFASYHHVSARRPSSG